LITYLLLGQVIGKVSNHDLVLGWDAVGRRATLTALTRSLRLGLVLPIVVSGFSLSLGGKWLHLSSSSSLGGSALGSGRLIFLLIVLMSFVSIRRQCIM
jgi:hypothetical protein